MRSPLLLALLVFAGVRCAAPGTPVTWPREQWLVDDEVGVAVAIPEDWVERRATTGLVASGREGTPAYYTTLTMQTLQLAPEASFASILDSGYTNDAITNTTFAPTVLQVTGDALGVRYDISFDVFDEPRRRVGVLIDAKPYVIDVSYVGPAAEFAAGLPVLERALDSLYLEPTG